MGLYYSCKNPNFLQTLYHLEKDIVIITMKVPDSDHVASVFIRTETWSSDEGENMGT